MSAYNLIPFKNKINLVRHPSPTVTEMGEIVLPNLKSSAFNCSESFYRGISIFPDHVLFGHTRLEITDGFAGRASNY